MNLKSEDVKKVQNLSANYIRQYSYIHGNDIYRFMDKYDIGKSTFGKIMDAAGRREAVHRLYGHHPVYNFPINESKYIWDFIEHEFSDLFTKQGLPILPGELLENSNLIKYCKSLTHNWNFVNGFDLLSGTVAIYSGTMEMKRMFNQIDSIETFSEFAKYMGIGVLELAISISTANPFLLIGALLQLTAGFKGIINDGSIVYFRKIHNGIKMEFSLNSVKSQESLEGIKINTSLESIKIKSSIEDAKWKPSKK